MLHAIVGHADLGGIEGIGFDNVCTSRKIGSVNFFDNVRAGDGQKVIETFERNRVAGESSAVEVLIRQPIGLEHGAHGTVEDQNTLVENRLQSGLGRTRHHFFNFL